MDESELKQYHIFLHWVNVLRETKQVVNAYKKEEERFYCSLASIAWPIWRDKQDNLFQTLHSHCCSFENMRCKNITVATEKHVVCMLVKMSQSEEYTEQVLDLGANAETQCFVAPNPSRLKYATKVSQEIGTQMIQRYMRSAIWKEYLGLQLTLLETYLCFREGIEQLVLRTIPNVWEHFSNLKQRILYCYKRACCRHCLNRKGRLSICRDCRCVYFCQEGWCATKSREDLYFGHSKEECGLLRLK